MAGRRCPGTNCPRILTGGERYCPRHARDYEKRRGTPKERGYDSTHTALRRAWQARIASGETVRCARCGRLISKTDAWALDHTDDRTDYLGASHKLCNDAAGGRAAHR